MRSPCPEAASVTRDPQRLADTVSKMPRRSPSRLVRALALLAVGAAVLGWLRPDGIGHNGLLDERQTKRTQGELLTATVVGTVENKPIHRLRFRFEVGDGSYERESFGIDMPIPANAPVTIEYLASRPPVARIVATKVRVATPSLWFWLAAGSLIAAFVVLMRRPAR